MTDSLVKKLQRENEELRKANEQLQQELRQQRQIADELTESEEMFATFLEHNPAYVFFKDEKLRSLRLSRNYEQMLGRPLEEILGKTMEELFPPELAGPMIELDSKILRDGVPYSVEEELNGRYYSTVKFPIVIEGRPARLAGFTIDITSLKLAEKALRESEALLAQAQKLAQIGSWIFDQITQKLTWSAETYRIFGARPDEFEPSFESFIEACHPDDREMVNTIYTASIREGKKRYEIDHRIIRKDTGEVRYVQEKCFNERDENGTVIRSVGMTQDITERKLAEEELRKAKAIAEENETRFKALHNASFGGIVIHDKGLILDCNQGLSEITGYTQEELIGMDGLLLISEKSREIVINKFMSGYQKPYEAIGRRKNGEEFPLRLEAREIPYQGKQVRTVEFRDITAQKEAERTLAAEKERLAVTLRSIGDGVITTDTTGKIVMMNRIAEELTGWLQTEAQGQPLERVFTVVDEITRKPCENPVKSVIASGRIIELANHTLLISRDGTERVIADSGAPIKASNNETIGVVLVFRDMTDKQKLLAVLQRTDKLEAIGVLAGGIAHDFNNLLSGIFGFIELARMTDDGKKIATYLDQALIAFERAKNLTQQLLAFAKGGAPMRKTGYLEPVIRDAVSFALSGSAITCEFNIDRQLWAVDFDKGQIEQVIDNIVINAQQAMPTGGRISLKATNLELQDGDHPLLKRGNYIKISIADTGVGMTPDVLQRVFDPFFTTRQKGNGLGLTTCYAIVHKHSGMIDVESAVGKGSTFHIILPASPRRPDRDETMIPTPHYGKGRILIMDDEAFVRKLFKDLLSSMGYSVLETKNGEEAIKMLGENTDPPVDAAIFDLTIQGGMGGKDAIIQVRKQFPDMPVIVSSGYSEDPVMAHPQQYGFTDSLSKPFRKHELADLLTRHIK
ncbi:MAG: PAS domain S-box protein [Candidatus Riflebacteria bacterium]|nr:PAS domain S-box protein [Candidatus Riflebacteria bacterium]